jgi:hypothetical protein
VKPTPVWLPRGRQPVLGALVLVTGLVRCSLNPQSEEPSMGTSASGGAAANVLTPGSGATGTGPATDASGAQSSAGGAELAPPEEKNALFEAPVVTGTLLWSANAQSGRVAVMDAVTLRMQTFGAGYSPKYLAAVPPESVPSAIVLNTGSSDATWFRLPGGLEGAPEVETIATHQGANRWAVSPSGCWAIAWTDVRLVSGADVTQQFQDATVIHLCGTPGGRVTRFGDLGKRPSSFSFDQSEERALGVTEDGISVILLSQDPPRSAPLIALEDNPLADVATREVVVTPDGRSALVRHEGGSSIAFVDLLTGDRNSLELGAAVTDLDLRQDGQMALAVLRDRAEVVALDLSTPGSVVAQPAVSVPGEFFGSAALAHDGSVAVLYTTLPAYHHVTTLLLGEETSLRTVSVQVSVSDMFMASDAQHAVAFLRVPAGSTAKGAFALIPTRTTVSPKLVSLPAPPTAVAIAPAPSDRALVTIRDDTTQTYGVYVAKLPSLEANLVPLASPPVATGIVSSIRKGYVAQAHPEGRITVIDLEGGGAQTITGFELAAKVRYSE